MANIDRSKRTSPPPPPSPAPLPRQLVQEREDALTEQVDQAGLGSGERHVQQEDIRWRLRQFVVL